MALQPQKPSIFSNLNMTTLIYLSIGTLVFFQIASPIISWAGPAFGFEPQLLKLGPSFLVLITGIGVWMVFSILRAAHLRGVLGASIPKPTLLIILFVTAVVIMSYIFLPKIIPSIFEASVLQLQSALTIGG